mgnify:CR=1 FL=1
MRRRGDDREEERRPPECLHRSGTDYGTALSGGLQGRLRWAQGAARPAGLAGDRCARSGQWGYAKTPAALGPAECAELIGLYGDAGRFRSTVDAWRYRFGIGEYRYFAAPLPPLVEALRRHAYPPLAAIANRWGGGAVEHAGRPSRRRSTGSSRSASARPDQADAAAPALRDRRLQLPAPGHLRRASCFRCRSRAS